MDDSEDDELGINDEGAEGWTTIRWVPNYDSEGGFYETEDAIHVCRYICPWPAARFCTNTLGLLDCGFKIWMPRFMSRLCGGGGGRRSRRGACSCVTLILVLALLAALYVAWTARTELHAVTSSPCYICNPKKGRLRYVSEALPEMQRYGMYVHGTGCALDDHMVKALDEERVQTLSAQSNETTTTTMVMMTGCCSLPWTRYSRYVAAPAVSDGGGGGRRRQQRKPREEDWRNAIPRLFVMGFRGAGTTSLGHYLAAHPDIAMRQQYSPESSVPWDDHFFAEVPRWGPAEIRAWMRRGWGEPTMADHQGMGKTRVEVGPDYLWRASSGAAGAVRRAVGGDGRFLLVLTDPVHLVREAHQRAVDAGVEDRASFARVVADELPRLAQCLWFGDAGAEEQARRVVEGQCGGGEPGRVGAPYLWRGLLSPFVHHWLRTASPGGYGRWYAIRAEDLLQHPNRTLNRALEGFAGLRAHDFGPAIERVWHPSTRVGAALAPKATWLHSWRAHLPRADYVSQARKDVADRLLDGAQRAARRWVPGLEVGLKTAEKLRRMHCRLSGFIDPSTVAAQQCLAGREEPKESDTKKGGEEEEEAIDALRDFYAADQERLMNLLDATDRDRMFQRSAPSAPDPAPGVSVDEKLREFYLHQQHM